MENDLNASESEMVHEKVPKHNFPISELIILIGFSFMFIVDKLISGNVFKMTSAKKI
jgi:hypothetical protein